MRGRIVATVLAVWALMAVAAYAAVDVTGISQGSVRRDGGRGDCDPADGRTDGRSRRRKRMRRGSSRSRCRAPGATCWWRSRRPSAKSRIPLTVGNHGPPSVEITLQVNALREDVTVTASPDLVEDVRRAGQPVNIIDSEDIATRDHHRRRAGRRGRDRRQPAADEPDHGRRVRARPDRQQGQRLRRRRALLERRAARRRQHVPRSDRAGRARHDRDRARAVERAVRQRRARRQRPVPDASADARRHRRTAVGRIGRRQRRHRAPVRRRPDVPLSYMRAIVRARRIALGPRSRPRQDRRRHRLARRGDAIPRRAVRRADGRPAARHQLPPDRRLGSSALGAIERDAHLVQLHAHVPGRRRSLRSAARRRRQPDLGAQSPLARHLLRAARDARRDSGFDHGSFTYSLNSQREERVNQGGNGNPTATIGHEPERTTVHGLQGVLTKQFSPRLSFSVGGDVYFEHLTSEAFNVNPVTGRVSPRRPRVPDGATFTQGGVFAQSTYDVQPDRVRLVGSLRAGGASYEAQGVGQPDRQRPAAVARRFADGRRRHVPLAGVLTPERALDVCCRSAAASARRT